MNAVIQDAVSSLTGNLPKAILCVRDLSQAQGGEKGDAAKKASDLQKRLLKSTEDALNGLLEDNRGGSQTFRSLTGKNGAMAGCAFRGSWSACQAAIPCSTRTEIPSGAWWT